jgi:SsrA-binding protein
MSAEIATNRKALREYHIEERLEAGIELRGTEVKSIRAGHVQLQGAFARIEGGQLYLYESAIQPYEQASHEQHENKRRRRLLVHRTEIRKLEVATEQAGCTVVAIRMYWKKNHIKVELGIGKGKANADKRADLKKRTQDREVQRMLAGIQHKR